MAKAITAAVMLLTMAARPAFAEDIQVPDDVQQAADKAGVDSIDLLGALNTTKLDADTYLCMVGEGPCPKPTFVSVGTCGWPICGAMGQRIYCIEGIESHHGAPGWMYNPTPVWDGEHAQGFLGYLPSTARTWGVVIGNRASEWDGASRMISSGAGKQFAGILMGIC